MSGGWGVDKDGKNKIIFLDWFTSARKSVMGQGGGDFVQDNVLEVCCDTLTNLWRYTVTYAESRAFPARESVIMGKPN